jgi:hypothetical protein
MQCCNRPSVIGFRPQLHHFQWRLKSRGQSQIPLTDISSIFSNPHDFELIHHANSNAIVSDRDTWFICVGTAVNA